jgi:hypothetical protein
MYSAACRLDTGDSRDGSDQVVRQITLAAQAPALGDKVVDALITAQRRLDRPLARHVRTQPQVGHHVEAIDVVPSNGFLSPDTIIHPER